MDLSIIVPIYNVEEYLDECLRSLLKLDSIKKKEIILVNDGSEDESYKIAEKYKKKYPEIIKYFKKENGGLSSARNFGLKNSVGEYIFFIDSDDYINYKKFEQIFTNRKKDVDVIVGNAISVYKNRKEKLKRYNFKTKKYNFGMEYLKEAVKKKFFLIEVWGKIYRRDFLIEHNLFFTEGVLHEDEDFTMRMCYFAKKIEIYDIDFYFYRQRENSIMTTKNSKNTRDKLFLLNKLIDFYDNKKIIEKEWINRLLEIYYFIEKEEKIKDIFLYKKLIKRMKINIKNIKIIIKIYKNRRKNGESIKNIDKFNSK